MIDIPCDYTASDDSINLSNCLSLFHEHDGTADQSLWAFEVLQENQLINSHFTFFISHKRRDLTIVVGWGQGVTITGPDWDRDLTRIDKGIILRTGVLATVSLVSPHADL